MNFLTTLNLSNLISAAAIIILVVDRVFGGKKKDNQDAIQAESNAMTILRNTVDAYKLEVDKLRGEIHEQALKTSNLEGMLAEKDKQLNMFKEVFQGRNPDMDTFMKTTTLSLAGIQNALQNIVTK